MMPVSQVDIEREIMRLTEMLEEQTEVFQTQILVAAEREADFKSLWAKEYLSAKGSIKEREAWSDYRLQSEMRDWKISEALVKATREKLTSLRTSIDALRTLSANVRAQT